MSDPVFFPRPAATSLREVAATAGAAVPEAADPELILSGIAPLEAAGPGDLAYMDNPQ